MMDLAAATTRSNVDGTRQLPSDRGKGVVAIDGNDSRQRRHTWSEVWGSELKDVI
jgi:hypothetical protein